MSANPVVIGNATLYLGDCLEILPALGKVDAVITDPPYGIGYVGKTRSTKANDSYAGGSFHKSHDHIVGDNEPFNPAPLLQWKCILWGANNYASRLPDSNGWLCWHKDGGIKGFKMSECELAWSSFHTSTKHFSHMWHGFKRESEAGQSVMHPTQKPIALLEWCIKQAGDPETILDPFMGSGTTGVACMNLGRKFIGIEIEQKYFDIACRRIEDAQRQSRLFA